MTPRPATEDLLRELAPQVLGAVVRRYGDFYAAEDAVQEALLKAALRWPDDGEDTLILLFMCCHPALTPASSIALTLRAVGGLTTAEIAQAFLVPEATMAPRISRAKQSIKTSDGPFELLGDAKVAAAHYAAAAGRTTNLAERYYLTTRAARLPRSR